jgi:hypothetical protein
MKPDPFQYDRWIADALRGVLRRILSKVEAEGLYGEHHYYITVDTHHPEVEMPGFLRAQYPNEITLVLQHQFRDLLVTRRMFEVVLSFSSKPHRLRVPFDSVTAFADPSVGFGLKIADGATATAETADTFDDQDDDMLNGKAPVVSGDGTGGKKDGGNDRPGSDSLVRPLAVPVGIDLDDDGADDLLDSDPADETSAAEASDGSAEVIALDAFRTKK